MLQQSRQSVVAGKDFRLVLYALPELALEGFSNFRVDKWTIPRPSIANQLVPELLDLEIIPRA
ncbi:MAG: hypothetical protein KAR22_18910, partial [Gammaproteobacteria bacterium]|nr:hypothetical protein [Gammaproteobacteria bacterium]